MPGAGVLMQSNDELRDEFEQLTENAARVQDETLARILKQNAKAEYLLKHGLNGKDDAAAFRSLLPLITYTDVEDDVQKIADGDKSPILTEKPVQLFFVSSGTSKGRSKLIPCDESFFYNTIRLFRIGTANRSRTFSPLSPKSKLLDIVYCGKQFTTQGGIKAGTGTTHYFRSEAFQMKQQVTEAYNSSPLSVIQCPNIRQATYCHLLFGLINSRDIELISSTFLYSLLEAFRMLEQRWGSLVSDIEHGILPPWVTDPEVRSFALENLRAQPDLSQFIRSECLKGFEGIIGRLWPNVKYLLSIMTGTMESYLPKMRYYAGTVPLVAGDYGASESWIAINLNPLCAAEETIFTVVPDLAYFEFIPLHQLTNGYQKNEELLKSSALFVEGEPVTLADVKVGAEYEIVLTTFHGLYRYRLGDVIQITGFYNSSPQFRYVCRKNVLLSINVDKNGERDLELVFAKASPLLKPLGLEVTDYTSYADLSTTPGHYVLFVELHGCGKNSCANQYGDDEEYDGKIFSRLQSYCNALEGSFVEPGYRVSRAAKTIGPLELCILQHGSFQKLADMSVNSGGTFSQFKPPRCVAYLPMLEILKRHVKVRFWSSE